MEVGIEEDMIITIEPGYYEEGRFGIRIENCTHTLIAEDAKPLNALLHGSSPAISITTNPKRPKFICFEPLTLVPIQRELIDTRLLSGDELAWLNAYHAKCAELTGAELKATNKHHVYEWLIEQTRPL